MPKSEEQLKEELNREKVRKARLKVLETSKRVEKAETELREAHEAYQKALEEQLEAGNKALGIT